MKPIKDMAHERGKSELGLEDSLTNTTQIETARHIAELCGALATLSCGAGLDLITYFLRMAQTEAESVTESSTS